MDPWVKFIENNQIYVEDLHGFSSWAKDIERKYLKAYLDDGAKQPISYNMKDSPLFCFDVDYSDEILAMRGLRPAANARHSDSEDNSNYNETINMSDLNDMLREQI